MSPAGAAWAQRTFAAFAIRNYRLFFAGYCLSMIGSWARSAAQQWLVFRMTGSETLLSWVSAASLLPIPLLAIPAGALADRVDKRKMLLWIQVGEMALSATLAALVVTGLVVPVHVLAIAAGMGILMGFEMPCRQAFIVEMVGKSGLRNAVALNSVMFNLALVLGPAIGAQMMSSFGMASVFVFDTVSFVAAIVGFALIALPPRPPVHPEPTGEALLAGLRHVVRDRVVRTLLLLLALAMVFGWSYASLLAAYARDVLHTGERGYGWLFASSGLGAILGAVWVAGHSSARPSRVILGSLMAFAASLAVAAFARDLPLAIIARTAAGFAMIAFFATANTAIQMSVPDAIRGRVMALWTMVFGASLPLGQLAMGAFAGRVGTPAAFGVGASVVFLGTLAVAIARPFPRPHPDPAPAP